MKAEGRRKKAETGSTAVSGLGELPIANGQLRIGGSREVRAIELPLVTERRSARSRHGEERDLPLDGVVGRELGELEHVHELVDLFRDLLERVLGAVDAQSDTRDAFALGLPDGQRVDVVATPREQVGDARERARLVLDEDRESVLHLASNSFTFS